MDKANFSNMKILNKKFKNMLDTPKSSCIIRTHKPMSLTMHASVVKLVDTTDSKSVALKSVSVRVRPLVPLCLFFVIQ